MKTGNTVWAGAALALATALAATGAQATTNLVQNPGFESGSAGWSFNGWEVVPSGTNGVTAESGSYFATTGCTDANNPCTLSQTLATTAGQTYDLSFGFNPGNYVEDSGADTKVYWNGTQVADLGPGANSWTDYAFHNLVASGASTTLTFSGYQIPAFNGVDDVSVTQSAGGVPEPASWAMMLVGFLGLGGVLRAHRRADRKLAALCA